jgi:PAS domain S-box-containing protein
MELSEKRPMPALQSLKFKVLLVLALMMGAFFFFLYLYVGPILERNDRTRSLEYLEEMAEQIGYTIDLTLGQAAAELSALAAHADVVSMDPDKLDGILSRMDAVDQFFNYFFVVDRESVWRSYPSKPRMVGNRVQNNFWITETYEKGRLNFLDVHVATRLDLLVSGFAAPVISAGGDTLGLVRGVITVSEDNFVREMVREIKVGSGGYAYVVDSRGRLLAHPTLKIDPAEFDEADFAGYRPVEAALAGDVGVTDYELDGRRWVAAFRPIPLTGWGVVVQQPLDEILAVSGSETSSVATVFFLVYFLTALILGSLALYALRPINKLVTNLKEGRSVPAGEYSKDEVGLLAREISALFTERLQMQTALVESEERFRMISNASKDMIHLNDSEGRIIFTNPATERLLGYNPEDLQGRSALDIVHPDDHGSVVDLMTALREGKEAGNIEIRLLKKGGPALDVEVSGFAVRAGDERQYLGAVIRDASVRRQMELQLEAKVLDRTRELSVANAKLLAEIQERKETEKALLESEERYRDLFEDAGDLIQIVAADGRILYVNPSWRRTFGFSEEELGDIRIFDLIDPDCSEKCKNTFGTVMSRGRVEQFDATFLSKAGEKIEIDGSASCKYEAGDPATIRCILRDVTEKKRMEAELQKMHKLESLGVLAGGIAHDFNNLLTAIMGNISLAKLSAGGGSEAYTSLGEAETATLRAQDLTQQLLTFSKGGEPIRQVMSLKDLLVESSRFALRGSNVRCDLKCADDLLPVEADGGQISQVIHNIVLNADQAMPDGGVITIEARNIAVEGTDQSQPLEEGDYVEVSIRDRGAGISSEHLARVFDPFFSTKEKGQGLGLASAYSIVAKHGGVLTVDSVPGEGTTFQFVLPATGEEVIQSRGEGKIHSGTGRILLMDDEFEVRQVAARMLTYLGYEVEGVADGKEAISVYMERKERGEPFDAVIMDLTIPGGMGGKEAVQELIARDRSSKVVVSSGYANDPIMASYREYGFSGVIPKPYRIETLSRVMREIMET